MDDFDTFPIGESAKFRLVFFISCINEDRNKNPTTSTTQKIQKKIMASNRNPNATQDEFKDPHAAVVRAIDAGFGLIKYSFESDAKDGVDFGHFFSSATLADMSNVGKMGSQRNTVDVPVGNQWYEVGPDITKAQGGDEFGRDLTDGYIKTPTYEALMKGALAYIDEPVIDMLVVGLPVNTFQQQSNIDFLQEKYCGDITISRDKSVLVKRVEVRPQPQGGFFEVLQHAESLNELLQKENSTLGQINSFADFNHTAVLVVDPGEFTLDYLLIDGGGINMKGSSAIMNAGRHRTVTAVADALGNLIGKQVPAATLPRINEHLRTGKSLPILGKAYDLKAFKSEFDQSIKDPLNQMFAHLGNLVDKVELIMVTGGHPAAYAEYFRVRYPNIPVFVPPSSIYSNARGFQFMGEELLRRGK